MSVKLKEMPVEDFLEAIGMSVPPEYEVKDVTTEVSEGEVVMLIKIELKA